MIGTILNVCASVEDTSKLPSAERRRIFSVLTVKLPNDRLPKHRRQDLRGQNNLCPNPVSIQPLHVDVCETTGHMSLYFHVKD